MEISQTCFPLSQVSRFGMTRTLVHCEHPALSSLLRLALSLTVQSLLALLACCLGEGRNWSQRQLHPKEQRIETEHWLGCQTVLGLKSGFCTYQLCDLGQNHDRQCLSSPFLLCQWNIKFAQVSVPMISGEPGPDLTVNKWSVLANEMKRERVGDSSGIFTPWYEKAGKEYLYSVWHLLSSWCEAGGWAGSPCSYCPPASYSGKSLTNDVALADILLPRGQENVETPIRGPATKDQASQMVLVVKNLPRMQEMQLKRVWSLGQKDPLEKGMATHSGICAWRIPWIEEPGRLQSIELQRVGHDWSDLACTQARTQWLIMLNICLTPIYPF